MNNNIAKELSMLMHTDDDIMKWLQLYKTGKLSRNFINHFIDIVQKTNQYSMSKFIPEIRECLEDGIAEPFIIWLYSPDTEFNKIHSKECLLLGKTLSEEPIKTYWNISLSAEKRKKLREAFKDGLTIRQASLLAKSHFSIDEMDTIIKYFKLGIGLNLDFNESFSIIIARMKKEAQLQMEENLSRM